MSPGRHEPVAVTAGTAGAPAAGRRASAATREQLTPWLRLAAFFGLAAFGAGHWAQLVDAAPAGRTLLVLLVATCGAAAMVLLSGARPPVGDRTAAAAAVALGLVTIVLGLGAAGLPLKLLGPENWAELVDGLDRGLAGIQGVEWPYDGRDEWIRLTILLGAPFLLGLAATLAFFPVRRGAPALRAAALVLLLLVYGTAVTEHDPGAPLLRGLALLCLVGAWLWLPRLDAREGLAGAAAVLVVGVVSLPLAAALDGERPWWNYRAWNLFGSGERITFNWSHRYGPLDWPRDGTTLMNVASDRPHYWKAETLDSFDGLRWYRSGVADRFDVSASLPNGFGQPPGPRWELFEWNPRWTEEVDVTVRSLSSDLILGAGTVYGVDSVPAVPSGDGTARVQGEPLEEGDSYTVRFYAPDPTRNQMRRSSEDGRYGYPDDYSSYTRISLPSSRADARESIAGADPPISLRRPLEVPLAFDPFGGDRDADQILRDSRYGEMYRLALDWTRNAENGYDRVKAIENNLQSDDFIYAERVPTRALPLNGFLLEDKRGYCQQFSGTMALMLRMLGIPTRVAAGFSPGSYNTDTGEYRVRDLDAHSWVEVYFTGIGWVPFDPTPTAAPAQSQSAGAFATSAVAGDAGEVRNPRGGVAPDRVESAGDLGTGDDGNDWVVPVLILLIATAGGGAAWYAVRRVRLQGRMSSEQLAEAQLAELQRALNRLDWNVPAGTTLRVLERRLLRTAGPHSAGYARRLRQHRYDPRMPYAPGAGERRALRRELSSRAGLLGRLRALAAIPPGGPKPV